MLRRKTFNCPWIAKPIKYVARVDQYFWPCLVRNSRNLVRNTSDTVNEVLILENEQLQIMKRALIPFFVEKKCLYMY